MKKDKDLLYLAGPMRGYKDFNFPAFDECQHYLELAGFHVVNPAEQDRINGFDPTGLNGEDYELEALDFDLREALSRDFDWIINHVDAVVMLPGWEKSRGATTEKFVAELVGVEVMYFDPTQPAGLQLSDVALPVTGEVRITNEKTGGEKGRKPARFELIPSDALFCVAEVYGKGAEKYADRNWEKGIDFSLMFGAMQRHMWAWWMGENLDPETRLSHLGHAAFHVLGMLHLQHTHPECDDRPK